MRTDWLAKVEVQGGVLYELQVAIAEQFQVNEALLVEKSGPPLALRWSRERTGGMTVFLPGNLDDNFKILVRGEMPIALDKPLSLPLPHIEDCRTESQNVIFVRDASVLVKLLKRGGLSEQVGNELKRQIDRVFADGLTEQTSFSAERIVAGLAGKAAGGPISLSVERNAPHIEGSEMITMRRERDAWSAVADLDIKVSGGMLDALRFDLPIQPSEPVTIDPPMKQDWSRSTGDDRYRIVLRPAEPIAGPQHIRLIVPIAAGPGQRIHVPDIKPIGMGNLRRFVRLPTNANGQQLIWEPRGLSFERLPGSFAVTSPTTEVYRTCEVISDRFDAVLQSVETGLAGPRVRLTDIRLGMAGERTGYGTAAFDVDPAGAGSCLLDMPSEFRLVHSELNGAPTIERQVAPNQWNVAFADAKLPQRLEIVFTFDRTIGATGLEPNFRPPSLVGFTVDQTLWSIGAAVPVALADEQGSARPITILKREAIGLKNATGILATTAGLPAGAADQGASPILAFDARLALSARSKVDGQRKRAMTAADRKSAAAEIAAADAVHDELAQKYGLQELFADLESHSLAASGPSEVGQAIRDAAAYTTSVFAGGGPSPGVA
ncbi:MAG TPA: hypothetical protein VKB78_08385, partial [Pirellulales bacterium]|nr:hypothetical protein [Pirellulales bacterium]